MTYRKSHMHFRLVPESTTLADLEGPLRMVFKNTCVFRRLGAHHEKLNEDRLYCQRRRCSPVTLDSYNIRFMRIFAGVPWKGGIILQWGNQKRVFSRFWTLCIRHRRKWDQHYYTVLFSPLSPFHWSQNTWPWMSSLCCCANPNWETLLLCISVFAVSVDVLMLAVDLHKTDSPWWALSPWCLDADVNYK